MTNAPLLERMVDLTAIRDADLLDLSLLRTVREVCAAEELSLLRIAPDSNSIAETRLRDDGRLALTVAEIHDARTRIQLAQVHGSGDVVQLHEDGRALLVYPMMEARGIRTCLRVGGTRIPGVAEQAMLQGFARFFQNYRSLLDDAQRDALTGLRNRKTFDDVILRLFAGGADSVAEQGVWLGIVDIDHFKRVNDTFGHLYGDEVLLLVAQLMQRAFRQDDLLFRFGGEEFVIVLRGVDRDTAVHLFERFRPAVAEHLFPQVGQVTLSTGIVALTHGRLISEMLDEADKALYWAKQHGRNRAAVYAELIAGGHLQQVAQPVGSIDLF
ncbi:GGDEF domain-containing protein [Xanthomonas axonopodis pv. begoniae]|uniref:GGDEF domain-containing protein n=1 Tax=Xanthomonas phaseoli TaxID=1985254 RepID=UPI0015E27319|nr:GGDEF domain-containing protein [Xanthomonas phaseoli]MBO9738361.1 GGDEF domain-containing protein [Xanthomonas axonopodis pv. begoniae]MBO9771643.1 GGDEF domain-containing protein [Xanthomonas axonopodis pv. begoniae]MCC8469438.1 GGDEF domain-containing protein [Xanthomonas phaseoli]